MKYTPRQAETNVNVSPTSPVKEFLVLTGGLLAIVLAIYFLMGLAVNLLVPYLSVEFEKKLAGLLMPEFGQDARFKRREDYLQSLADQLQNHCAKLPYDFKVHYNPAPQFNAVAFRDWPWRTLTRTFWVSLASAGASAYIRSSK